MEAIPVRVAPAPVQALRLLLDPRLDVKGTDGTLGYACTDDIVPGMKTALDDAFKTAGLQILRDPTQPHDLTLRTEVSVNSGPGSNDAASFTVEAKAGTLDRVEVRVGFLCRGMAELGNKLVNALTTSPALNEFAARLATTPLEAPATAGPAGPAGPLPTGISSVAVLPAVRKGRVNADVASILDDLIPASIAKLSANKIRVVTKTDIDAMLSLEKTKDALGCESTTCAVEIAGSLGVDSIITASLGVLGNKHMLTLVWINQRTATVIARHNQSLGENPSDFDTGVDGAISALLGSAAANKP